MRRFAVIIASAFLWLAGCSEFVGPHPRTDTIRYPVGIAVHPSGDFLYVVNSNFDARYRTDVGGTVTVLNAETLEVYDAETVEIGSFGAAILLNAGRSGAEDPDRLYVTTRGDDSLVALRMSDDGSHIWCPNAPDGVRDALACRVTELPRDPFALALVDRSAVPVTPDRDVIAVAGLGGSVSMISIAGGPEYLDVDDALTKSLAVVSGASALRWFPQTSEAWVAGRFSRRIRGISAVPMAEPDGSGDRTTGELAALVVTNEVLVPSTIDAAEVRDLVFSADGTRAYLALDRPSAILVLDMELDDEGEARATVIDRWDLDGAPAQMFLTEERGRQILYAALSVDEAIAVLDVESGTTLQFIPLDGLAYGLAFDPVNRRAFASLFDAHAIVKLDLDVDSPTFRQVVGSTR